MTLVPEPLQKPLRRLEIVTGLLCVAVGAWALVQAVSAIAGGETRIQMASTVDTVKVLAGALYLLGFGGGLLYRGYLSLVLWVMALAVLAALGVAAGPPV